MAYNEKSSNYNIKIENSTIQGSNFVGGIGGNVFGKNDNERVSNLLANNIKVKGISKIGGLAGRSADYGVINSKICNSEIVGSGSSIGGAIGEKADWAEVRTIVVENCNIEGTGVESANIGGIIGINYGNTINYMYASETKVSTNGKDVGGIIGKVENNTGMNACGAYKLKVSGNQNVGGLLGNGNAKIQRCYANADVIAYTNTAGGLIGNLRNKEMSANVNTSSLIQNYFVGTVNGKNNVGGHIGNVEDDIYVGNGNTYYYYKNYIQADLFSADRANTSLGIGNSQKQNENLKDTYYYKYSKINGENPNEKNELFISNNQYLTREDIEKKDTYTEKLKWNVSYWELDILKEGKYPTIKHVYFEEKQEGVPLPKDEDHIIDSDTANNQSVELIEPEYTFDYNGKIIKTYKTYSEIIAEDGSKVVRKDVRLYVKNGKLYALPVSLEFGGNALKLVANNFVIDSYNGKEYETVLGEDGRLYDLKEPINYPKNFVNNGIEKIGNNLDSKDSAKKLTGNDINEMSIGKFSQKESKNEHEVEVVYKNGDKLKFNYQTGEIISSSKSKEQKESTADSKSETSKGLLEYVREQFSEIGNYTNTDKINIEMQNKYEETIKLENKLEEISVEEAIKKYKVENSGESDFDEEKSKNEDNNINANIGEAEKTEDNNETNNSLKEKKYISIYNAEKDDYQIYQEEELLDTSKQEVISENEKIEANNLNEYYASDGKATNMNMGIVWIALSIIGVIIILFVIKKRD
ncbi:MAG: hypothetical protein ACLSW4_07830 [Clostridia bacterium]